MPKSLTYRSSRGFVYLRFETRHNPMDFIRAADGLALAAFNIFGEPREELSCTLHLLLLWRLLGMVDAEGLLMEQLAVAWPPEGGQHPT